MFANISTEGMQFLLRLSITLLWTLHWRQNELTDIFRSLQAVFMFLIRFAIIFSRFILIISLDFSYYDALLEFKLFTAFIS